MEKVYYTKFKNQFCNITLAGNEDGLQYLDMEHDDGKREFKISQDWIKNDDFFSHIIKQLNEYFSGKRQQFENIKLNIQGTDYQKKVWAQLLKIPYGERWTYKDVAVAIGNAKASRAVGMANGKNKIPIIIPCHRVIGSNGKLTGFAHGLNLKEKLLNLEQSNEHE